jgi:hypothetical protein
MPIKRILCLANSRKLMGRCLAGFDITDQKVHGWIRPVSAHGHGEVSEIERRYTDGTDPKVLDIIDVALVEHRPHSFQQENWLIDTSVDWVRTSCAEWRHLARLVQQEGPLWVNGFHTYNGVNDRIPVDAADRLGSSLRLIHVPAMQVKVYRPGAAFDNPQRRVQAHFQHNDIDYAIWVTDPVIERRYLAGADGTFELGECYLTLSLGEPHQGFTHKLVAAIIQPGP